MKADKYICNKLGQGITREILIFVVDNYLQYSTI
jgi:hypothetical protein